MKSSLIILIETAKQVAALINNCLFSCFITFFVSHCKMLFEAEKMSLNEVMQYFQPFVPIPGKIIPVSASLHWIQLVCEIVELILLMLICEKAVGGHTESVLDVKRT